MATDRLESALVAAAKAFIAAVGETDTLADTGESAETPSESGDWSFTEEEVGRLRRGRKLDRIADEAGVDIEGLDTKEARQAIIDHCFGAADDEDEPEDDDDDEEEEEEEAPKRTRRRRRKEPEPEDDDDDEEAEDDEEDDEPEEEAPKKRRRPKKKSSEGNDSRRSSPRKRRRPRS